jgi:hypothetical protein
MGLKQLFTPTLLSVVRWLPGLSTSSTNGVSIIALIRFWAYEFCENLVSKRLQEPEKAI